MIRGSRGIQIDASPDAVFDVIETMPDRFPVYAISETKTFHCLLANKVLGIFKQRTEKNENC